MRTMDGIAQGKLLCNATYALWMVRKILVPWGHNRPTYHIWKLNETYQNFQFSHHPEERGFAWLAPITGPQVAILDRFYCST